MIRRLAATALVIALLGGGATGAAAQGTGTEPHSSKSSDGGLPIDTMLLLFAAITVGWGVMTAVVLRRRRRNHELGVLHARPRGPRASSPADETGRFVPLAPILPPEEEQVAEPEEATPAEQDPAGPFKAFDRRPVSEPVPEDLPVPVRDPLDEATTYEIVWYRDEAKLQFALQPVDGRSAPWARVHSDSFTWSADADPPADLRGAQRAHGRLRARLAREGWRPAGRGSSWFSHRFHPPRHP